MNESIRIKLSIGLIVIAILHAVALSLGVFWLHPTKRMQFPESAWQLPTAPPATPTVGEIKRLNQPQNINLNAQGELKQQSGSICPNCVPLVRPRPLVVPARPTVVTKPPSAVKRYQLALFIGRDAKSQLLLKWFNEDPTLYKLREACEFQVYTASDPLYLARYAKIVPSSQFPVVLFQDSNGGHIHAAGGSMIPRTADELFGDFRQGYGLYRQAKQAQKTGTIKQQVYSWDQSIKPTMRLRAEPDREGFLPAKQTTIRQVAVEEPTKQDGQSWDQTIADLLQSEDCPDGYCPVEPEDRWRPFDKDLDPDRDLSIRDLFDRERRAVLRGDAGEIATLALVFVAVVLLGFILIKRGL